MENNTINPSNESMPSKRNLPRDVFLHLFAIVALYWSAVSFTALCWQYINYFFPDVLSLWDSSYLVRSYAIRFAVSSLAIMFPLFALVSYKLNGIYNKESQVRDSKIRKWLIYLTLFIASLIIVGDLIYLLNTVLGGEIKIRFVLKSLSVLAVAGAVFGYYLDDVKREKPSQMSKYFVLAASLIAAAAVAGSLFIIGTPAKARKIQIDQRRVSDMQIVQSQIVNYWQRKERLPQSLNELNDPISGYFVPVDPETSQPYEYNVKSAADLQFELCAVFAAESPNDPGVKPLSYSYPIYGDVYSQNWEHQSGRYCFDRQIDKQLYPPLGKEKFQ